MGSVENAWRVLDVAIIGGGVGKPHPTQSNSYEANQLSFAQEA